MHVFAKFDVIKINQSIKLKLTQINLMLHIFFCADNQDEDPLDATQAT